MRLVVGRVVFAIPDQPFADPHLQVAQLVCCRVERNVEWRDARAQEVIRAARPHLTERLGHFASQTLWRPRRRRSGRSHDGSTTRSAQIRQDAGAERGTIGGRGRRGAPEAGASGALGVVLHELAHLIDGLDAAEMLPAASPSREETVAAEDDAVATGCRIDRSPQHECELEARALPGTQHDSPAAFC